MDRNEFTGKELLEKVRACGEEVFNSVVSEMKTSFPELTDYDVDIDRLVDKFYYKTVNALSVNPSFSTVVETLNKEVSDFLLTFMVT